MRGPVLILLIVIGVSFFAFVAAAINNLNYEKIETKEQNKELQFSTFTSAVCENRDNLIYCKDELFVNCNGEISKADGFAECNGIKMKFPEVNGFAVFEEGWEDPRSKVYPPSN